MATRATHSNQLCLISWPFHNGLRNAGMGLGAARLAQDESLREAIQDAGWTISCEEIEAVDESRAEIARTVELIRRLASCVERAAGDSAFPLVLAGNCNSALGTVAGVGTEGLGVVWVDAHADFDDPEDNTSGFFDVMGLAMLTGRGWRALRGTIAGHQPIPEHNVVLAGVRDLEPYQRRRLNDSELIAIPGPIATEPFDDALADLASRVSRIYLHIDLDAIDLSQARANEYAAPGGPSVARLSECIWSTCERFEVAAAAITAYDPAFDPDGTTLRAARQIVREIATGRKHGRAV